MNETDLLEKAAYAALHEAISGSRSATLRQQSAVIAQAAFLALIARRLEAIERALKLQG